MSSPQRAKFFVNQGIVSSREDMLNVLRPLLKQTVSYRYERGRQVVARGTGWVERIVVERPDVSTYFTPIAITLNIDSFEHLEFETRPDQLLVYTLVQGDERVVVEFAPGAAEESVPPLLAQVRPMPPGAGGYVQMELLGLAGPSDPAGPDQPPDVHGVDTPGLDRPGLERPGVDTPEED